jgi:hypothetical protein
VLINELAQKILIAVVCLGVGYGVGRYRGQATMGLPRRQRWRDIGGTIMGVIVVVAVGFTVFQVQGESVRQRDQARCLADYSYGVAQTVQKRSEATGDEITAEIAVLRAQLQARSRDDQFAAIERAIAALEELQRARAAAPLPERPVC